jgi:hypothetical protein
LPELKALDLAMTKLADIGDDVINRRVDPTKYESLRRATAKRFGLPAILALRAWGQERLGAELPAAIVVGLEVAESALGREEPKVTCDALWAATAELANSCTFKPSPGGDANGLWKGLPEIPLARWGSVFARKAPPKKYAT